MTALLGRLGSRVAALHVEAGAPGAAPFDPTQLVQTPVGRGGIDIAGLLAAVLTLEYAVPEFDLGTLCTWGVVE